MTSRNHHTTVTEEDVQEVAAEIVRNSYLSILYHEQELRVVRRKELLIKEIIERCDVDITEDKSLDYYEELESDDDISSPKFMLMYILGQYQSSYAYHADELNAESKRYKIICEIFDRTNIDIPYEEIRKKVKKQIYEKKSS